MREHGKSGLCGTEYCHGKKCGISISSDFSGNSSSREHFLKDNFSSLRFYFPVIKVAEKEITLSDTLKITIEKGKVYIRVKRNDLFVPFGSVQVNHSKLGELLKWVEANPYSNRTALDIHCRKIGY